MAAGETLGPYRVIERIGAGGMGEVWKAEDTRLGRVVAIKILPPAVAADQESMVRMRREARTAPQINHPNIATSYSFEEIAGRLLIVMELVEGKPLTRLMAPGLNRNWEHAERLARETGAGSSDDPDLQTLQRFLRGWQQHRQPRAGHPRRLRPGLQ